MYTDLRTISGWRCAAPFSLSFLINFIYLLLFLVAWSFLAANLNGWGALAVRFRLQGGYKPSIHSILRSTIFRRVSRGEDNTLLHCFSGWHRSVLSFI